MSFFRSSSSPCLFSFHAYQVHSQHSPGPFPRPFIPSQSYWVGPLPHLTGSIAAAPSASPPAFAEPLSPSAAWKRPVEGSKKTCLMTCRHTSEKCHKREGGWGRRIAKEKRRRRRKTQETKSSDSLLSMEKNKQHTTKTHFFTDRQCGWQQCGQA
jgi:hypothetical protein